LLADNPFNLDCRQTLEFLFKGVPLAKLEAPAADGRVEAECRARLGEAQILSANAIEAANYVFSSIPIPKLTVAEVQANRKGSLAPEVYLSDTDFMAVTRCDRATFYRLPEAQRAGILSAYFQ
jgi:hypothetical protein